MADEIKGAQHWSWSLDSDGIGWLGADRAGASTNTLSRAVLEGLDAQLEMIERARPKGVVLWSAKKNGFVAGADISEFKPIATAQQGFELVRAGQQVMDRLERLPCPTVAAVHGFALKTPARFRQIHGGRRPIGEALALHQEVLSSRSPALRGTQVPTLCIARLYMTLDVERRRVRSHAERGNEEYICVYLSTSVANYR